MDQFQLISEYKPSGDQPEAIDALARLSDGHRLVGIISHVAELKSRIDKQIVVTKASVGGSRAEIIV